MGSKVKLAEKFISINGEGRWAGELAVFLRLSGCNLTCSYCDTMWVNECNCDVFEIDFIKICRYIEESGAKHVTITGGEPLLQEVVVELCEKIKEIGVQIEIETNGSIDLAPWIERLPYVSFTMDYKMSSSNMEKKMYLPNLTSLRERDTLKLVCGQEDLSDIAKIIENVHPLVMILVSPVFGQVEPQAIVEFIMRNKLSRLRVQLQLHKFIWSPEARGV